MAKPLSKNSMEMVQVAKARRPGYIGNTWAALTCEAKVEDARVRQNLCPGIETRDHGVHHDGTCDRSTMVSRAGEGIIPPTS
jgi:hypothetical protein